MSKSQIFSWFSLIHRQVWILMFGRFLSTIGTGLTLFYAPIFFVNQIGLSATSVGFALGCASISGVVGRILSGSLADSPQIGRRNTLLLATAISALACFVLATTHNFFILIIGQLISGLGVGLYWPATEAVVADLTPPENSHESFALTRLADNLGLGMGIICGGFLVSTTGNFRTLFIIDAVSFIVFFAVVYVAIAETYQSQSTQQELSAQIKVWIWALGDRRFLTYIAVNIIFTIYISQLHTTLPLYLKNFVPVGFSATGFTASTISTLFAWHLIVAIFGQLPAVSLVKHFFYPQALAISAILWAIGFSCIWFTGLCTTGHLYWATLALGVLATAVICYTPSAYSLVTYLAPASRRGVYFSINSLCWAIGYFIGPLLGGWALDQSQLLVNYFWLGLALSVFIVLAILLYLNRILLPSQ
ncbi:MFS transporter [Chlorogloeopsis sp. ULAP01]|uniref:MFS transporter n=1 Tax=Chlorogloeopsis sp. ULAP01 TaxID=3056483 RepID=UPI0025AA8735|nr:MFS transporter [Chlorogloeopsis sp. ULAP01]MDM9383382.1 MFS transporter [Chlorogloeopsis sp. ULAP01]